MRPCERCGNLADVQGRPALCTVCSDRRRDPQLICIVHRVQDLLAIERSGAMRGRYFVLGRLLSPLDGVGPDELPLAALAARVREDSVKEVILATPPSVDGEATALLLARELAAQRLKVTRIASGIPTAVSRICRPSYARPRHRRTSLDGLTSPPFAMPKLVIRSDQAPAPVAAYSQAVRAGDFLFLSGQIALDPKTNELVTGGIEAETRRVLDNLSAVLEAGGATRADVVKITAYLADMQILRRSLSRQCTSLLLPRTAPSARDGRGCRLAPRRPRRNRRNRLVAR